MGVSSMPSQGEDLGMVRVAEKRLETASRRNRMSRRNKDFHRPVLQKIFSNSPVDFVLTLGDANVILDSKSEVTLGSPAARLDRAR